MTHAAVGYASSASKRRGHCDDRVWTRRETKKNPPIACIANWIAEVRAVAARRRKASPSTSAEADEEAVESGCDDSARCCGDGGMMPR